MIERAVQKLQSKVRISFIINLTTYHYFVYHLMEAVKQVRPLQLLCEQVVHVVLPYEAFEQVARPAVTSDRLSGSRSSLRACLARRSFLAFFARSSFFIIASSAFKLPSSICISFASRAA
ncbi:hypothetical protein KCU93_g346, partial [Aureobasidium melanogenum]